MDRLLGAPTEIWALILVCADNKTLNALRQACRRLYIIAQSPRIVANQVDRAMAAGRKVRTLLHTHIDLPALHILSHSPRMESRKLAYLNYGKLNHRTCLTAPASLQTMALMGLALHRHPLGQTKLEGNWWTATKRLMLWNEPDAALHLLNAMSGAEEGEGGDTCLLVAVRLGRLDIIERLMVLGVGVTMDVWQHCFMRAVRHDRLAVVEWMLDCGAQLSDRTVAEAMDVATALERREIIRLLAASQHIT